MSLWSLAEHGPDGCRFEFTSRDGDMGFPGAVKASATYRFVGEGRLRIRLEAEAEAATPVNLTCHAYFNLDGTPDMRAHHRLGVAAAHYLPASRAGIPTGAILPVDGTRFDFRVPRSPRDPSGGEATIDATLVLDRAGDCGPSLREVASLSSERSGVALRLLTTEPGLQVYDGSEVNLDGTGIGGQPLGPFCGLALEAQRYPDGPNRPYFAPCILRPGEVSCQETEFAFAPPR